MNASVSPPCIRGWYRKLVGLWYRLACIPMAIAIREPASSSAVTVLAHVRGIWPMRMLMFPLGLRRKG
ncbi:MAG: hypothetical protein HN919_12420 [Verrucomicrobia bacterium]|nr:hypothetical protein [Verrucomicrobiota bacterium]MBT7067103.1 hypothetical protein [Verrucomicrobiota bacterium]MBT7699237.1 hypothetical protein [Verrucomicrobiota bacterium]